VRSTYQRWVAIATGIVLFTGCGHKGLEKPLPQAEATIRVSAPWPEGGRIPARYTCDGAQTTPKIRFVRPSGTRDAAIVMTDPDAPGGTFVHWTHWGASSDGTNSFGKTGYAGPCPPKGDKPHRYVITVYALRRPLGLVPGSDANKVVAAIRAKSFASGSVTALYSR